MKKKRGGGGGGSWMDTYGDMVTLLLCFFVLLFSMSTLDKEKMIQLVQAFNPDALKTDDPNQGSAGTNPDPVRTQADVEVALANLYEEISEYVQKSNTESNAAGQQNGMAVTIGDGYVFISLNDTVFFDGDSPQLRDEGKPVLDEVADMLAGYADSINEIKVLGHTARQIPTEPNTPIVDRTLSSGRAASVLVYLQDKGFLDPARMISVGMGEWRPVATNDTADGRAKNRRVELIVSGINVTSPSEDVITQYYTERGSENPNPVEPAESTPEESAIPMPIE